MTRNYDDDCLRYSGSVPDRWTVEQLRKVREHPCYSKEACHTLGRMHLPVAPKCNIQCNYCLREFDCVNESRPGVTSRVLEPAEAIEKVKEVIEAYPFIRVIGIAGPGDPLFNDETFETLRVIRNLYPHLQLCLSTNGLLLAEKLPDLVDLGIDTLTVTVNAIDPQVAKQIYSFIYYQGTMLRGLEAAKTLVVKQRAGIQEAVKQGIMIKVNTVYIPTINEDHIVDIAYRIKELGVYIQNITPLIPQHNLAHIPAPTGRDRRRIQDECAKIIPQMRHCRQCRADAVGLLSEDFSAAIYNTASRYVATVPRVEVSSDISRPFRVAVTTSNGKMVDLHFGHARRFHIYDYHPEDDIITLVEVRDLEQNYCQGPECDMLAGRDDVFVQIVNLLRDCRYLLCRRIGVVVANALRESGLIPVERYGCIEEDIRQVIAGVHEPVRRELAGHV